MFYCASLDRGYTDDDLLYEVTRLNNTVSEFYMRESSNLFTVEFLLGEIVSPDIEWEGLTLDDWLQDDEGSPMYS